MNSPSRAFHIRVALTSQQSEMVIDVLKMLSHVASRAGGSLWSADHHLKPRFRFFLALVILFDEIDSLANGNESGAQFGSLPS